MNILLLGSGGREHALAWKIAQSTKVSKLFIAPGNPGTAAVGQNVDINANNFDALKCFALDNDVQMVVVGPEDPLVNGIYDDFKNDARTTHIPVIVRRVKAQRWKAAKTSPRLSWLGTLYPQRVTKPLLHKTSTRD